MTVVALHLFCEACGCRCRVERDDAGAFRTFVHAHWLPVVDGAVMEDGRLVEVVTR